MKSTATRDLVLSIKEICASKKLSQKQLQKLVWDKTGAFMSESSIYRVLKAGSEEEGFNYAKTLEPMWRALMSDLPETQETAEELRKLYEAALLYKEGEIEELNASIEQLKAEHEKRCREYEDRLALWLNQIDMKDEQIQKKDERMDAKDALLAKREAQIDALMAEIKELRG